MKQGTIIRFTADNLGAMVYPDSRRYADHIVRKGDHGEYVGPHWNKILAEDDWHLCTVAVDGGLYVAVHSSMFEEAKGRSLADFAAGK